MIVNRECEIGVKYNKYDAIVEFMDVNWSVVPDRYSVPDGYTRVARAGHYDFYADTFYEYERPRYCVINPQTNEEV